MERYTVPEFEDPILLRQQLVYRFKTNLHKFQVFFPKMWQTDSKICLEMQRT